MHKPNQVVPEVKSYLLVHLFHDSFLNGLSKNPSHQPEAEVHWHPQLASIIVILLPVVSTSENNPVTDNPDSLSTVDVLIVGAGISGIDAAYHLQQELPEKTFSLVDRQASFGGTWRTHKYPGIRSDSDLYTFGFSWKPWTGVPIATAEEILSYLEEALDEQNIKKHIRYRQSVQTCLLYTSPSPRDRQKSRMPSSA